MEKDGIKENEGVNGLIRQYAPEKTDLRYVTDESTFEVFCFAICAPIGPFDRQKLKVR